MEKRSYLKYVFIGLIVVFLLIGGFFLYKKFLHNNEEKSDVITPVLYEVTKEGSSNKMYLFGSIHLADAKDLNFPDYVLDAYNNSHYVACEYNMVEANTDLAAAQELAMKMLYQDGTTISDHISSESYEKLVDFLTKKDSYTSLYDYYKPVFFYSLLSSLSGKDANISSDAGIDEYFINKANEDKKEILEVESMDYQMDLLLGFSDSLYELAINDTIDNYEDSIKEMKDLYEAWKAGNIDKILELNDEDIETKDSYTEEQKQEIDDFNKKLVNDRNITMTDKASLYFDNNQDVFFMVGTLHIIGDDGIAKNLQDRGYTVKRVE